MKLDEAPLLKVQIKNEQDVVQARQRTRQICANLGFPAQDQTRMATAISELARNVFQYAGQGLVEFAFSINRIPQRLWVTVRDQGPGIANLAEIQSGQYVSTTGMGLGLMGAKKLTDAFEIESTPGQGTRVRVGKDLPKHAKRLQALHLGDLAEVLSQQRIETPIEEVERQNRELLVTLDQLKRREEELVQLNQELGETNRGVVALYAEIDEKAASLQRANEIKTSFLANMTHEFRTPLTSIMSLARLLLDRLDGELTSEQEKQVRYIRSSADGLMDLVNNLLDIAKVEAGKISIKPTEFTVTELIGALRGVFRPLLPAGSPVDLVYDVPDEMRPLITDEAKLSQILRNLVSNALKFTERGIVRVKVRPDDHDTLLFEVRDTGIGLAEEHFELIFEDFSQIESQVQKKLKGTGLGLPLSRKLATLIGGQLWVESVLGHGASFFLRIPWHFRGSEEGVLIGGCESSENNHSSAKVFHEPRILLIDDEETCRYVLKALISRNYQAHFFEANGGHEGLHVAAEAKPDVIFLDLVMPDMTGLETLRNLRSDASLESIPVFINTTKKMSEDERDQLMQLSQGIFLKDAWDSDEQREQLREKFAALRIAPMSGATDRQISGRTHV